MEKKTFKLNPERSMTKEQMAGEFRKALICNNITYVMVDALNSFLIDMCSHLDNLGLSFKCEEKMKFNELRRYARMLNSCCKAFSKNIYNSDVPKEVEDAAHDSDWWYLLIKLLYDRLGDDKRKTHMLLEFLDAMPSEGHFKVNIEDFMKI